MYTLGDITFEGLTGFDSIRESRQATYAELALIGGKPRLQRTGDALIQIDVSISLHAAFSNPAESVAALEAYRFDGSVLPLYTGEGTVIGQFIIVSIESTVTQTSPTGTPLSIAAQISLKENYDPSLLNTAATAAVAAGFAVGSEKVIPVKLVRLPVTSFGSVSNGAQAGKSACIAGSDMVRKAQIDTSQTQAYLTKARTALSQAKAYYEQAKSVAEQTQSIIAIAPTFISSVQDVVFNIDNLRSYAASGDLTNSLTTLDLLESSISVVDGSVLNLNKKLIIRGPQ